MRVRRERTLEELYGATERISEPEITPVLQGLYRIQGPVDECKDEPQMMNSDVFPVGERSGPVNQNLLNKPETGTCNVCSAPCSSCFHFNQNFAAMESKYESGPTASTSGRKEEDNCSSVGANEPVCKRKAYDDCHYAYCETSNLSTSTSSHDACLQNNESITSLQASVPCEPDQHDDRGPRISSEEADENGELLAEQKCISPHSSFTLKSCKSSNAPQNTLANLVEEKHSLEQHGDNISCSSKVKDANTAVSEDGADMDKKDTLIRITTSDSLLTNKAEKVVPQEGTQEIEQTPVDLASPTSCTEESFQQKCTGAIPDVGSSHKSGLADLPPSKSNPSRMACFPSSGSQSTFHQADVNGLARTATSELRADVPVSSMENEKLLGAGRPASVIIGKQDSGASLKCEVSKECIVNEPTVSSESAHAHFGADIEDSKVLADELRECDLPKHDISNSLVEASGVQVSDIQQPAVSEGENSGEIEDDVKVCDICGDAGQEELLAICSRCTDGAEHTYCMRISLDEVPAGDWLCEECQLKEESEKQKPDHSQAGLGASEAPSSSGKSEKSVSTINSNDLNTAKNTVNLHQSSHISSKMNEEDPEATSQSNQKFSEPSSKLPEVASPRKKNILSHESSLNDLDVGKFKSLNNSDVGKLKQASALLGGQSTNSLQTFARPQSSSASNPSKTQVLQIRGSLSKSMSFNNSKVPKVKQLIDDVPQKQRNLIATNIRKDGQDKAITKSASFRSVNSCSYSESVNKTKLVNPSQSEEPRGLKQVKERSLINKKGTIFDRPSISPSPRVGNSVPSPKTDVEVGQKDAKANNTPDLSNIGISQGSNNGNTLGRSELKKPYLLKASESTLPSGLSKPIYQKSGLLVSKEKASTISGSADKSCSNHDSFLQKTLQTSESSHQDIKVKDSPRFIGSKQTTSGSSRTMRCQRCNEAGHATQFCAVDKLRMSALKPFAERNLKEGVSKSSKWKDAADMVSLRARKPGIRSPDQSEEVSTSSLDHTSEVVTSKDHLLNTSSGGRNSPSLDVIIDRQEMRNSLADPSKPSALIQVKQKNRQQDEAICFSKESNIFALNNISDESKVKMPILSYQASLLTDHLRASIIPQLEYVWQGGFEVLRAGRLPELCDGVQAHLSSCVSPKVIEAVRKFSSKVQLEEVSRLSSWPPQFQENAPKEDNIALFFFARDIESYEKNYCFLVENMLKNDLILRGNIDTVELLIFPSNLLPEKSQRWNKLYFLWGVFRDRRKSNLKDVPDLQEKPCETNLNKDLTIPGIPSSVTFSGVSSSQDLNYCESSDKEVSGYDTLPKAKVLKPTIQSAFLDNSNPEVGDGIHHKKVSVPNSLLEPAVDENIVAKCHKLSKEKMLKLAALEKKMTFHSEETLHQAAADDKLPEDQIPSLFPTSGSLNSNSHLPNFLSCLPKHRINTKQLNSEPKSDISCLNNFSCRSDGDNVQNAPHDGVQMGGKDKLVPMYSASLNHVQVDAGNQSIMEEKSKWKENIMKSEIVLDEQPDNLIDMNHGAGELMPSRKRVHSSSMGSPAHLSGGTSRSNGEIIRWKEIADCTSVNDRELKKMKLDNGGDPYYNPREEIFDGRTSSKVHPLSSCFVDGSINYETMVDNSSTSSGRYFPRDSGPARNKNSEIFIDLSSDDEESPNDAPDLELALGDNKKSPKKILPLFAPNVGEKSEGDKLPLNDGSDMTESLSLSLACPASDKAQEVKPTSKTGRLLSEKPLVNTSLFLFGSFSDT